MDRYDNRYNDIESDTVSSLLCFGNLSTPPTLVVSFETSQPWVPSLQSLTSSHEFFI